MSRFQIGDRVRLSDEAIRYGRFSRVPSTRQGTVRIISGPDETFWVRWDGRISDQGFDEDYLELVERPR